MSSSSRSTKEQLIAQDIKRLHGLGYALYEEAVYGTDGTFQSSTFLDYSIAGPPEVGVLALAGARLLGLSTSWGDGLFPIWVDRDKAGGVIAIRLELGSEKRRQMMEAVWARAVADSQ